MAGREFAYVIKMVKISSIIIIDDNCNYSRGRDGSIIGSVSTTSRKIELIQIKCGVHFQLRSIRQFV